MYISFEILTHSLDIYNCTYLWIVQCDMKVKIVSNFMDTSCKLNMVALEVTPPSTITVCTIYTVFLLNPIFNYKEIRWQGN